MGEHGSVVEASDETRGTFTKALLDDVAALERMIEEGRIERGVRRIGAEQEMFLVGADMSPAPVAMEVLARVDDPRLTTELARYNLEANLTPREFGGGCLRALEREIEECVGLVGAAAEQLDADVLLTGILPTLRKADLGIDNLTPAPRYHELNRSTRALRGADFHVLIAGIDELDTTHDNVMLESCNTSFQIHVGIGGGVRLALQPRAGRHRTGARGGRQLARAPAAATVGGDSTRAVRALDRRAHRQRTPAATLAPACDLRRGVGA